MQEEDNACRGFIIGILISLPIYALAAWIVQLAWNAFLQPHITYWQALIIAFILGVLAGAFIGWLELVRKP